MITDIKVNFLIAGAQKSGTTKLDTCFRQHPNICMALKKEVHYFDNYKNFENKYCNYDIYHTNFIGYQDKLIGESTPMYMFCYDAPRRIWEYNPDMKLILILRNPITRAFSHWNMMRLRNLEASPFLHAIALEEDRTRKELPYQSRRFSYISRGWYTEQIRKLLHFFPKKQIHYIKSDDLRVYPQKTLDSAFSFLELNPIKLNYSEEVFSLPYKSLMSLHEFECLREIFYFEIKSIEKLLKWDCSDWLDSKGLE